VQLVDKEPSERVIMDICTDELPVLLGDGRNVCTVGQGLNAAIAIRM